MNVYVNQEKYMNDLGRLLIHIIMLILYISNPEAQRAADICPESATSVIFKEYLEFWGTVK